MSGKIITPDCYRGICYYGVRSVFLVGITPVILKNKGWGGYEITSTECLLWWFCLREW